MMFPVVRRNGGRARGKPNRKHVYLGISTEGLFCKSETLDEEQHECEALPLPEQLFLDF